MQIFNARQLRLFDKNVMNNQQIDSVQLMYRAAEGCTRWLLEHRAGRHKKFTVFCGVGNNGGDGLAIALQLAANGFETQIHLVAFSDTYSDDFQHYFKQVHQVGIQVQYLRENSPLPDFDKDSLLIDAIFGYGLSRPPEKWVENVIQHINQLKNQVVAIDLPSGLYTDAAPNGKAVVQAEDTLTFAFPKLSFVLPETGGYAGRWHIISLGETPEDFENIRTDFEYQTPAEAARLVIPRKRFSHKGTYGHVVLVGGSYGKVGAMLLAAKAALRAGCGLVSVWVPQCGYVPFQTALPEVMVQTDKGEKYLSGIHPKMESATYGVGMGMDVHPETAEAFGQFLDKAKHPMVIDADALNLLSAYPDLLKKIPVNSILTPHPGELKRLIGTWTDDFDRLEKTREWAVKLKSIILIKGAYTAIVSPQKIWFNSTGNPGMATAGSGDVLAGTITGLLAQGYPPESAARLGVLLHGLAGDLAAKAKSEAALLASDIIENLSGAYRTLEGLASMEVD